MSSHPYPHAITLDGVWSQRLRAAVLAAWQDWQGWRLHRQATRETTRQVCALSDQTLDDLGAPEGWRAAAAHCRARAGMDRDLLRLGVVPGLGW
jgi:hypothetical protein